MGHGFVTIQLDPIKLIESYQSFIHIVNLTKYQDTFQLLVGKAITFPGGIPHSIKALLDQVERELYLFGKREKRGLLNAVGSGIKFLTGNLDAEDAKEFEARLKTLETNQENVVDSDNQFIKINQHINDELTNMTNFINNETITINLLNENYTSSIQSLQLELKTKIAKDNLRTNIQSFYEHVMAIKQAISFTKAGILSSNLLEPAELKDIELDQYQNIRTGLIHNATKNTISFLIKVPIFSRKLFFETAIVPIPNYNKTQLIIKANRFVTNLGKLYIMKENDIHVYKLIKSNEKCLDNQVNNQSIYCKFEENNRTDILQISDNYIITRNLRITKIENNCGETNIKTMAISGNNIIKIVECSVTINGETFTSETNKYYEHFIIPTTLINIRAEIQPILNLETLHHQDMEHRKELTLVKYRIKSNQWSLTGIVALTALITLAILIKKITCRLIYRQEPIHKGEGVTSNASHDALSMTSPPRRPPRAIDTLSMTTATIENPQITTTENPLLTNNPFHDVHYQFRPMSSALVVHSPSLTINTRQHPLIKTSHSNPVTPISSPNTNRRTSVFNNTILKPLYEYPPKPRPFLLFPDGDKNQSSATDVPSSSK